MNVAGVLDDLVAFEELFGPDSPCPILHEAGNPRLIVVTGGNASGKSLFALIAPDSSDDHSSYADLRDRVSHAARVFKTFNDLGIDEDGHLVSDKSISADLTSGCVRVY